MKDGCSIRLRLVSLQFVHVCLILGSPEQDPALQVSLANGFLPLGKGQDHLSLPAANTSNVAQDASSLPFSKDMLLAHVQLVYQDPQVLFCKAGKSIFVEISSRSLAFIYQGRSMGFMVNKYEIF